MAEGTLCNSEATASGNVTLSCSQPQSTHWEGHSTGRLSSREKRPYLLHSSVRRPRCSQGWCLSFLEGALWAQVSVSGPKATFGELLTQRC